MLTDIGGKYVPPGDDPSDEDLEGSLPQNIIQMMKQYGKNGIVVSGVVSWIQVNKNMAANGIWKQVAEQSWNDEEITEAKNALLAAAGGERLAQLAPGMCVNRKSVPGRKVKEIKDIIDAITALEEDNSMPLVLASSGQMRKSPQSLGSVSPTASMGDLTTKMISIEDTLRKFMESSKEQMESLTEEVKKKTANKGDSQAHMNTPSKRRRLDDPEIVIEPSEEGDDDSNVPKKTLYSKMAGIHPLGNSASGSQQQNPVINQLFKNIMDKSKTNMAQKDESEKAKAKGKNVFHGSARSVDTNTGGETILAADVALVASGIALDAEPDQLKSFLVAKGVEVVGVECLTKKELIDEHKVRSKTMKVTIKAASHEKAMDKDLWPLRVGVRYFRAPPRKPQQDRSSWAAQSSPTGAGKDVESEKSKNSQFQPSGNRFQQPYNRNRFMNSQRKQSFGGITVENMFEALGSLGLVGHP